MPDGAITVLVVDDHAMIAEGLTEILTADTDITVVGSAATAEAAARLADEHKPDVVLMDYRLPDGDGATAAERIRAAHPSTAVIMVTASDHDTVIASAIEAGCSGYITKDRAMSEVVAAVHAAARGDVSFPAWALARMVPHLRERPSTSSRKLTERERDVLALLVVGRSTREMAEHLGLSQDTVRSDLQHIRTKLGATTNTEAVAIAVRRGISD